MRAAQARQQPGQPLVDAHTAVQIEERDHLGPDELRADLQRVGPRAAKGRRRTPGFVRRLRLPERQDRQRRTRVMGRSATSAT